MDVARRLAVTARTDIGPVGRIEQCGQVVRIARPALGLLQRAERTVRMVPKQLDPSPGGQSRMRRVAPDRSLDPAEQLLGYAHRIGDDIEAGEFPETLAGQRIVVQFIGQVERHRAASPRLRGVTHPQRRLGHAEQGDDGIVRITAPDHQIAGFAVVAVGPSKVLLGVIDLADTQIEQSEVTGLVDAAQFLLDLEVHAERPRLVAPLPAGASAVIEHLAMVAQVVLTRSVVGLGDAQQRVVGHVERSAVGSLDIEQRITGTAGLAAERLGRNLAQDAQDAVGLRGDDPVGGIEHPVGGPVIPRTAGTGKQRADQDKQGS